MGDQKIVAYLRVWVRMLVKGRAIRDTVMRQRCNSWHVERFVVFPDNLYNIAFGVGEDGDDNA